MTTRTVERRRPNIVSVHLTPQAKSMVDRVCQERGMTIKTMLGRLIEWFVSLDKTEQSIVLAQVEQDDIVQLAELILERKRHAATNGHS